MGRLISRREVGRSAVIGAAVAALHVAGVRPVRGQVLTPLGPLFDAVTPIQQQLARDTFGGLCALVVPGPDVYSQAQGVTDDRPGAVDAVMIDFLLQAMDKYLPVEGVTVPISLVVAAFFNNVALLVDPLSVAPTPFPAPFSNLTLANKMAVFELIEGVTPATIALLDEQLPEPLTSSVSGLVELLPASLVPLVAFGTYSEWPYFDPNNRMVLTSRPVGWELSGYLPGLKTILNGSDDFKGYYQGRKQADE